MKLASSINKIWGSCLLPFCSRLLQFVQDVKFPRLNVQIVELCAWTTVGAVWHFPQRVGIQVICRILLFQRLPRRVQRLAPVSYDCHNSRNQTKCPLQDTTIMGQFVSLKPWSGDGISGILPKTWFARSKMAKGTFEKVLVQRNRVVAYPWNNDDKKHCDLI